MVLCRLSTAACVTVLFAFVAIARASSFDKTIRSEAVVDTFSQAEPTVRSLEPGTPIEMEWAGRGSSGQGNEICQLKNGEVIERALSGGEVHRYEIQLDQDQFLQLRADQWGIDIVVRLTGPDSKRIVEMDSPNGGQGPEALSFDRNGKRKAIPPALWPSAAFTLGMLSHCE